MIGILLLTIGFMNISFWDLIDIAVVGYIFYRVYKLLKGSVAFYILLGLMTIYGLSWLVSSLEMELLNLLLSQFVNVGVIMLLIIFQPEVRKFLLMLGSSTPFGQKHWLNRLFNGGNQAPQGSSPHIEDLIEVCYKMAKEKTGALIVIISNRETNKWSKTGTEINAQFSSPLIESIFNKYSPLHDGALILLDEIIIRAGYVLPLTTKDNLPQNLGLRHRAGIGVTETTDAKSIIVSEESGKVSFARKGTIHIDISPDQLRTYLMKE